MDNAGTVTLARATHGGGELAKGVAVPRGVVWSTSEWPNTGHIIRPLAEICAASKEGLFDLGDHSVRFCYRQNLCHLLFRVTASLCPPC